MHTHTRAHTYTHTHAHTHMHKHTCAFTRTCHAHMKVTDRTWRGHAEVGRRMEESHVPLSPSHHVLETGSWSLPQRPGGSRVHKTSPLTGKQTFHLYTGQQPTIHVIISRTSAVSTESVNIHFTCADRQHFQSKQPAVGLQHIHDNCLPTDNKKGPKINIMIASTGCGLTSTSFSLSPVSSYMYHENIERFFCGYCQLCLGQLMISMSVC